jgi:hypothetical protein
MTNTSQPQTFNDLYISLLNKVREQTSQTATVNQAKSYINTGLQDMHIGWGERFPWAERQARLTTMAPYSTGTVSIAKGSVNLTGTGTNWATANSFGIPNVRPTGKLVINGSAPIYEISNAAIGATSLTLTSPYVDSSVVNGPYLYFEDEYDLDADFLRPLDMQYFDTRSEIKIIDRNRFRRNFPKNSIPGKPGIACILDRAFVGNTVPVRRVALYRAPSANFSIPYSFVTNKLAVSATGVAQTSLVADTDEPIVPLQYRHAIILHGLFNWYRDKKDDTRSAETRQEFVDLMIRIAGDTEVGERRPTIQPVMSRYRGRARSPYRRGTGRSAYSTGSRFDRMEDW